MFGSAVAVARAVPRSLPTGSHLLEFDAEVWKDDASSRFVRNDITPRQKMLGSVLERLRPGLSRPEIVDMIGPSLDTPYFETLGRDLIYLLGPERDSFVRLDSEWLLIWLDESGRFERYATRKD